ncbi:MAG: hypothetical protein K0S46_13 [Moraxellaceae bacterium]|jgi:hypothetical protein|nr:hypothetical protein [Moraxellaceae bacterium]
MRRLQSGISYLGVLALIGFIGMFIKVAATVGPAYYDNYTINKIIVSLFRDGRANSVNDFKRGLSDRFQINNIRDKNPDDFEYAFEGRQLTVTVDYEVRKPFMGNLDVVMHFKKTYGSELKPDY